MDAAKKLIDWAATEEANELYAKNFAIVAMPGSQAAAECSGDYDEQPGQERFRLGGEEPRQDPRRMEKRYEAKAEPK